MNLKKEGLTGNGHRARIGSLTKKGSEEQKVPIKGNLIGPSELEWDENATEPRREKTVGEGKKKLEEKRCKELTDPKPADGSRKRKLAIFLIRRIGAFAKKGCRDGGKKRIEIFLYPTGKG